MKQSFKLIFIIQIISFSIGCSSNKIPNVLIIGDSISGGYFPFVNEELSGKAKLFQPLRYDNNGNPLSCCKGTTQGVNEIDIFLADTKWDIIHFNFGLHDLKHINPITGKNSKNLDHPRQASPEEYSKNLKIIISKLRTTKAKLIFATTTPYPDKLGKQMRSPGMPKIYNEVAIEIMDKNNIEINDLYSKLLPVIGSLQRPKNVHFTEEGYKFLAKHVAQKIINNL